MKLVIQAEYYIFNIHNNTIVSNMVYRYLGLSVVKTVGLSTKTTCQ